MNLHGKKVRHLMLAAVGTVLLVLAIVVTFTILNQRRLQNWIDIDRGKLEPYPIVLVQDGKTSTNLPDPKYDFALLEKTIPGRLVVEITRTDYFTSILGTRVWVKMHLVTSKPGDERIRARIKLLYELRKVSGDWVVENVTELAIP